MALSYSTVVTRKGQTTIPAELREKYGIKVGDRLTWWEEDGKLQVVTASQYVKLMTEFFQSRADPSIRPLTIAEMKEAAAEGWTERARRWLEQQ